MTPLRAAGTILATDGNEHIRLLPETELTLQGYEVVLTSAGLETLAKTRERAPDLLILDLRMPDMYDLGILRTIRDENRDLPILLSTVYKRAQDDSTVKTSRPAAYLVKSFGIGYLKTLVRKSL